jgi:hypothetical protein
MEKKFVSPGYEWKEERGVNEASDEERAVWLAVTLNADDGSSS